MKFARGTADGHGDDESTDSEAWEERESSRTHSVKFSEDSGIADKDTPFVRQNTPHPKELKLKAHKLFAKEKNRADDGGNLDTLSEEVSDFFCYTNRLPYIQCFNSKKHKKLLKQVLLMQTYEFTQFPMNVLYFLICRVCLCVWNMF